MIGSPHHVIQDVGGGVEPVGDFNFSVRESGGTHGAGDCRGQYSVSYICSHKRISLRRLVALRIPKSQRLPAPNLSLRNGSSAVSLLHAYARRRVGEEGR